MDTRIKRIKELRSELFDLANSFAMEGKGQAAVELHGSCNCILRAAAILSEGETAEDDERQIRSWLAKNQIPGGMSTQAEERLIRRLAAA